MRISVRSMRVYLSALRSAQIDHGFTWSLSGHPLVARALRAAKRRYGMTGQALKIPVSLATLLLMCKKIPGWPVPSLMCHDDRLFVCASVIAVLGFLRGGEFLWSPSSGRPLLRAADVFCSAPNGLSAVSVRVSRPKARWWLVDSTVHCFDPGLSSRLRPSFWLEAYRSHAPVAIRRLPAAFVLADGSTLSKAWMLRRTSVLLEEAGVSLVDSNGAIVPVRASSWRAGGVHSAKAAGVSDAVIQAMGRWSSVAWFNYHFSSLRALQSAASLMAQSASNPSPSLVVGSFSQAGIFADAR